MTSMVAAEHLRKSFGANRVLDDVSFTVARGEVVCLIGASGSGKSTLLRCINHLEPPDSGRVLIEGTPIGWQAGPDGSLAKASETALAAQRARIGFVFQLYNLWPHKTALGNVMEALLTVKRQKPAEAAAHARAMLAKVGLAEHAEDYPATLSGGQQQRVAIARALAMNPDILLFDEPTSALDPERVSEVIDVMRALAAEGNTMIVATHEMGFARDAADRMIFLHDGVIAEQAPTAEFFAAPRHERLRQFLARIMRP